ncbi:MAG: hypothetical protein P1V20_25785 [Verrucomicrobiales bacterium]|nr:hypothetical protein [Verrucomicrobiales bacterium]
MPRLPRIEFEGAADYHATMGINPAHELTDGSRPVPITDGGQPIAALFG